MSQTNADRQRSYRERKRAEKLAAGMTLPGPIPQCRGCIGEGAHSCEEFPLPQWAGEYLSAFERLIRDPATPVPLALADADVFATGDTDRPERVTVCLPITAPAHGLIRPGQVRAVMSKPEALEGYADRDWNADPVAGTLPPVRPVRHLSGPLTIRHCKPAPAGTFPGQQQRQQRRNQRRKEEAAAAFAAETGKRYLATLTEAATMPPIPFDMRDPQDR